MVLNDLCTRYRDTTENLSASNYPGAAIAGALAAVAPVAFTSGTVLVRAPLANVMALAPRTLEGTIFPPQRMDVGLTLVDVEELVDV